MIKYLQNKQQQLAEQIHNFYTSNGIHVYFKDQLVNDRLDVGQMMAKLERRIPSHVLSEIEMIIIGWFDEFEERSINAFYQDGAIHISNYTEDNEDLFDDLIHEVAHSVEQPYGNHIYGDGKVMNEFLAKRKRLHSILWNEGYKAPLNLFLEPEYDEEFDEFLFQEVGYDKLSNLVNGLFVSAYAPTSLREYFATGFTEFYLDSNHTFLKKSSPELYKKLFALQDPNSLDN